jgi:hypothetical protein
VKKYIYLLASVALLAACEQKKTTVTNPPAENKTETNTTIVKESPAPANKVQTSLLGDTKSGTSTTTTTTTTSSPSP